MLLLSKIAVLFQIMDAVNNILALVVLSHNMFVSRCAYTLQNAIFIPE